MTDTGWTFAGFRVIESENAPDPNRIKHLGAVSSGHSPFLSRIVNTCDLHGAILDVTDPVQNMRAAYDYHTRRDATDPARPDPAQDDSTRPSRTNKLGAALPTVHHGDCIQVMNAMPANSIDAIVTDPPYGLGFMGRKWDSLPPSLEWAEACMRVLKPGGHIVAFGGTRTWHRLAVAIEDAGFEMRDSLAWLYGSGFPKSHNVGKSTATDEWDGWGTALKPAFEPIVLARKPFPGTVAKNVLEHGTGAINIDACRIAGEVPSVPQPDFRKVNGVSTRLDAHARNGEMSSAPSGRWPANVVLDQHTAAELDKQSGYQKDGVAVHRNGGGRSIGSGLIYSGHKNPTPAPDQGYGGGGGASRFFYTAKAPKRERPNVNGVQHPTVKPLAIMQWLLRLVTPPDGTILDPFAGSGTTVEAAMREGFDVIGIEKEAEFLPLIQYRIDRQAGVLAVTAR